MAAATVTTTAGRAGALLNCAVLKVTIAASSTAYATSSGGFPFDLRAALTAASNSDVTINGADVLAVVPLGVTDTKYALGPVTIGTPTSTTLPCTVHFYGKTGSLATEIDDATLTSDSFQALVLIARNGAN